MVEEEGEEVLIMKDNIIIDININIVINIININTINIIINIISINRC